MVVADFTKMEGPLKAHLQLRAGYGYEGLVSRPVQAVMGGLEWRSSDYLSVFINGVYSNSPVYISREVTAGLGLRY